MKDEQTQGVSIAPKYSAVAQTGKSSPGGI